MLRVMAQIQTPAHEAHEKPATSHVGGNMHMMHKMRARTNGWRRSPGGVVMTLHRFGQGESTGGGEI